MTILLNFATNLGAECITEMEPLNSAPDILELYTCCVGHSLVVIQFIHWRCPPQLSINLPRVEYQQQQLMDRDRQQTETGTDRLNEERKFLWAAVMNGV